MTTIPEPPSPHGLIPAGAWCEINPVGLAALAGILAEKATAATTAETKTYADADTPTGPMYAAQQLALAVYVKELTDHNLPPAAVEDKVREFLTRPATRIQAPITAASPRCHRGVTAWHIEFARIAASVAARQTGRSAAGT